MRRISICLMENTGLTGVRQAGNKKEEKRHDRQIRTKKNPQRSEEYKRKGDFVTLIGVITYIKKALNY